MKDIEKDLKENGFSLARLNKFKPTTEERLEYLDKFVNDRSESEFINNKIEKYLLENQKENLKVWAKKATKKGLKADNVKTLIEKIDSLQTVLKKSDKRLLNGLIKQKLGFTISEKHAKDIYSAYNTYKNNLKTLLKNRPDYMKMSGEEANKLLLDQIENKSGDLYEFGMSLIKIKTFYEEARLAYDKTKNAVPRETKLGERFDKFKDFLKTSAGFLKSMKATLDVSAPRQLSAGAFTSKEFFNIAKKQYFGSLKLWKDVAFGNISVEDAKNLVDMMVMTRPNAINGLYRKLGVDIGLKEEAFPETLAGKIIGKVKAFPASEIAYSYAIQLARAEYADTFIQEYNNDLGAMKKDGVGDYVNQITGRGKVHVKWNDDTQSMINVFFFAPKFLAARIRTITDLQYVVSGKTKIEKMRAKTALNNALLLMALPMLLKAALRALDKDDPHGEEAFERFLSAFDPRSSEFGKGRIGDTRIDFSFGMAGLWTTLARGITLTTVNSKGIEKDTSWADVLSSFFEGKLSPAMRTIADIQTAAWGTGKGFGGEPVTLRGEIANAVVPISAENAWEAAKLAYQEGLFSPTAGAAAVGFITDIFGIGSTTYMPKERDIGKSKAFIKEEERLAWNANRQTSDIRPSATSSIMTKLTGKKQEQAVEEFKKLYNDRATALVKSSQYASMSDEEKSKALTKVRQDVNKDIKKKYGLK